MELSHRFVHMGMGQYLLIPFLVGWTSIYQLFWGSLGTRVLTHPHMCPIVFPIDLFIDKLRHPSRSQSIEVHRPLELQLRCEASRNRPCAGGGTRRPGTTWGLMEGRNGKLTCFYGVVTCNHGWRYILSYIYIYIIYIYIYVHYIYIYIGMDRNMNFASCHILRWLRPVVSSDVRQLFCQAHGVAKAWFWGPRLPASRNQHSLYAMMSPYERVRIRHLTDALPHSRSIVPIHSTDHRGAIHTRFLTCTHIYIYIHTHTYSISLYIYIYYIK